MLPRERVLNALAHKPTDRIPLDFWVVPEIWEKLYAHFNTKDDEVIFNAFGIDIREFVPTYIGPEFKRLDDGSYFDAMGVHRLPVENGYCTYEEYASSPLGFVEEVEDFEKYTNWPSIENYDFKGLSDKIGDAHKTYYIKLFTAGMFELSWALRGYENFMMDMVINPEIPHYIMGKLTDFYCEYVTQVMTHAGDKYDMVYTYDDIAAQSAPLMSKEMWSEFVKPYHEKLNKVIKSFGKTIMYHSCGAVYDMIGDLKNLPIDVLNPIQPRAKDMDMRKIKDNFGKDLCFHGGIDIQMTLPKGSVEDVKNEVNHTISTLGENGGYILTSAHYIQADTPLENIFAMFDAAKNYSKK